MKEGNKMKYSEIFIEKKRGDLIEFVKDEWGEKHLVHHAEEYDNQKFIGVDNHLNTDDDEPLNLSFTGRIRDAIETIRNGDGDIVTVGEFLGNSITNVVYFLNREFGEEIRKQSLEGWKDAKFGWIIKIGNKNPLNNMTRNAGFLPLTTNGIPSIYTTRADAVAHITELLDIAKKYAEKYSAIITTTRKTDGDIWSIWNDMLYETIRELGSDSNIVMRLVWDMIGIKNTNNNFKLHNIGYTIEQYLMP